MVNIDKIMRVNQLMGDTPARRMVGGSAVGTGLRIARLTIIFGLVDGSRLRLAHQGMDD